VPVLLSFIEQNGISKMKEGDIIIMEVFMHNSLIDNELFG
jgi:hypothetical protein